MDKPVIEEGFSDKFEHSDLPLIYAALQKARSAKASGCVIVHFAENGGVVAIMRELKEKVK